MIRPVLLMIVLLVVGCGDDPFTVEQALGRWDLQRLNATEIPGTTPQPVTVRSDGGSDSTVTPLRSFSLVFMVGSECSWTMDNGISGPVPEDDCDYAVSPEGTVSLDLLDLFGADRAVSGTAQDGVLTLTDQNTNVFAFVKVAS